MDFFNQLQDFFAGLTRPESLYLLVIGVLIFLLAFLLGLLIRGRSVNRYKKQIVLAERERADYEARYLSAVEKEKALAREVEQLSREKVTALDALEAAKSGSSLDNTGMNPDGDAEIAQQQQLIEELQQEIARLQPDNDNLDLQSSNTDTPTAVSGGSDNAQITAYLQAAENRFAALEAKITQLDGENARLENEVGNLQRGTTNTGSGSFNVPHQPVVGQPATDDEGEPLIIRADTTNPGVRTDHDGGMEVIVDTSKSVQVPIISPEDTERDNLQAIKNIGPFNEKELNAAGIYNYAQIAAWSDQDIEDYTQKIGYVPGLIKKSDWVGQARQLSGLPAAQPAKNKSTKKTAKSKKKSTTTSSSPVKATNLKVIEGIGPKIESILKDGGIKDLSTLASTSVDQLRELLAAAGNRYKSHNPTTWPTQAELAKNEQWTELKILQDKLQGGVI